MAQAHSTEKPSLAPSTAAEFGSAMRRYFLFDESFVNLNHGSFGTVPASVMSTMQSLQMECEKRPDPFIRDVYPTRLDESRAALAELLHVPAGEVVLVPNATTAVNTVLRSLKYRAGDKIVYFSTTYASCEHTIEYIGESTVAKGVKVEVAYPVSDDDLVERFRATLRRIAGDGSSSVKLAIIDTVVSLPGVRMPFERLVQVCREEGVLSLVDGAHGIGHIELDLGELDADFFTSNCHKWLYVPRGCAVLHVPRRNQALIRSALPTSHGFRPAASVSELDEIIDHPVLSSSKSAFVTQFEFVGTVDCSPYLCIPAALGFRREVCGGEGRIREYCQTLARSGGDAAAQVLGTAVMDDAAACLRACNFANLRLPISRPEGEPTGYQRLARWISRQLVAHNTFIAIYVHADQLWARFSAQIYLDVQDFVWGAKILKAICDRVAAGEGPQHEQDR